MSLLPAFMGRMNKHLTEIAFILDRSGSMEPVARAAIDGFNDFLTEQYAVPGDARLTLVLFDNEYLVPVDNIPIADVALLNTKTYIPRGSTALLDAIGETIERMGQRLARTPEHERPGKVIVAIFTDGYENSSVQFTWRQVAAKIKHQTDVYQWDFLFLGANQDAIATAANLNISSHNSSSYCADSIGTRTTQRASSKKAAAMRAAAMGTVMDAAMQYDLDASLSVLVAEEDGKERKKKDS